MRPDLQVRLAQQIEQPKLETIVHERLQAAAEMGCVSISKVMACLPVLLLSPLDRLWGVPQRLCVFADCAQSLELRCAHLVFCCRVGLEFKMFKQLIIGPLFEMRQGGVSLITHTHGSNLRSAYDVILKQSMVSSILLHNCL